MSDQAFLSPLMFFCSVTTPLKLVLWSRAANGSIFSCRVPLAMSRAGQCMCGSGELLSLLKLRSSWQCSAGELCKSLERRSMDYWCRLEMQCWPFSSALLQVPSHAGHLAPKGATRTAVDFKPLQLAEVCAEAQTIVLSCGRGCTLGWRTTSVNEEREQAAGQDKYLSAGHLPHLSSSPAAWLVPAPGRCHRACRYLLTPPLEPAVQGKLCSQHSVCPRDHPPQAPVGRAWLGGAGASRGAPGQAAVATRTQGNRNGLSTACASTSAHLPLGTAASWSSPGVLP